MKDKRYTKRTVEIHGSWGESATTLWLGREVTKKLTDICEIEYDTPSNVVSSLIMGYTPVPPMLKQGKFIYAHMSFFRRIQEKNPSAFCFSLAVKSVRPYRDAVQDFKSGKIYWDVYKEAYLKRLQEEDAKKQIEKLRRIVKARDVFIISTEKHSNFSLAKVLTDYLNGDITYENEGIKRID